MQVLKSSFLKSVWPKLSKKPKNKELIVRELLEREPGAGGGKEAFHCTLYLWDFIPRASNIYSNI